MEREFVSFTLEGDPQEYKLCYDFNELADAETLTGCNLFAATMGGSMNVTGFRAVLYAFLKTAHPTVTLKESGGLMATPEGRQKCMEALGNLLAAKVKEVEDEPESEPANA